MVTLEVNMTVIFIIGSSMIVLCIFAFVC